MTEYNAASTHSFNRFQAETPFAVDSRNPFLGTCRAVRSSIEQFEAALDSDHEIAILLASFGAPVEFRAAEIRFSPAHVITFQGFTDNGAKVQYVQHASQVNLLLKAVRKAGEMPKRVVFQYPAA